MNTTKIAAAFAAAAIAAAGAITAATAPTAIAEQQIAVNTTELGSQAKLIDGDVVQGWTVTGLQVSTDTIPHAVQGTLWEATATDEALQGNATPIVSNFNARAADGQTYRALFGVATPQGVNPSTLAQGQQTSGKIYFDVTGAAPDSVVYATNANDLIVWLTPPPAPSTGSAVGETRSYQEPAAETAETTTTEAPETPAAPAGAEATAPEPTAVPAGSQGTPLPEGAPETAPVPAGSQGTPLPEGEPGTTPAGIQEAPAAAAAPAEGTAHGPEAAPAAEAAPAEAGSQGTPLPEGAAPTTTPVVAPPA
ncbi:MPT63 family protein [Mycolicibacterium diernhoferi]|uniref:Phosphopeptide-binding protein n=1 Tax=Mycolicibacterium diernhoferi TaxID=1801 RepID=A0A2A7NLB8_9MYCO|nr:MPT63 family protein [Mycolicibacterium diernhoferi]PEG51070.1 phosphopeptide-binding protein [Mycolicibacterium diernhoferi]QYL21858.1 MPT63 family protein [Mycolicibacterium diernhoferi]